MTAIDDTQLLPWERELLAAPTFEPTDAQLAAWARADAELEYFDRQALEVGRFDIDDEVIPVAGPFLGYRGVVDELDLADDDKPFRVRFDELEGEPIAWYHADDLFPAGGAR